MIKDPVCGMSVKDEKGIKYDHKGQTFYFCSNLCKGLFEGNPERYGEPIGASVASDMATERSIAYFSMEIAIDPRIPTYSGGLGVLAGDTLRSCADLNVPAVAVTLLYEKGYFYQKLDEGNQYKRMDWRSDGWSDGWRDVDLDGDQCTGGGPAGRRD